MKKSELMKLAQEYAGAYRVQVRDEAAAVTAEERARALRRIAIDSSNAEQAYHSALLAYIEESVSFSEAEGDVVGPFELDGRAIAKALAKYQRSTGAGA